MDPHDTGILGTQTYQEIPLFCVNNHIIIVPSTQNVNLHHRREFDCFPLDLIPRVFSLNKMILGVVFCQTGDSPNHLKGRKLCILTKESKEEMKLHLLNKRKSPEKTAITQLWGDAQKDRASNQYNADTIFPEYQMG